MEEKKIIELELKIAQVDLALLQHQLAHAEVAKHEADLAFENFKSICINKGHMTARDDWKTDDTEVRSKYQHLFNCAENTLLECGRISGLIDSKHREIAELQSKLNN